MTFPLHPLRWALLAGACLVSNSASAQGAWCLEYQGSRSCGYSTLDQCLETMRGAGGICSPRAGARPQGANRGAVAPQRGTRDAQRSTRQAIEERRRVRQEELEAKRRARQEEVEAKRRARQEELEAKRRQQQQSPARAAGAPGRPSGGQARAVPPAPPVKVSDVDVSAVPNLDREGIRKVKLVLREKGFDPGDASGTVTPRMKDAVRAFQERFGIKATGDLDNQTLLALGQSELAGP